MKKYILFFLLTSLFFIACKKNTSGDKNDDAVKIEETSVAKILVGEIVNGKFVVNNPDAILKKWDDRLNGSVKLNPPEIKEGFIEKTGEKYYILVSHSQDDSLKAACLLTLENNKFYFDGADGYLLITCRGSCDGSCEITVVSNEGKRILVCTDCPDCVKSVTSGW